MASTDSTPSRSQFDVERDARRLDVVASELDQIKGKMDGLATKQELEKAKLSIWQTLIPVGAAISAALIIAAMNAAIAIYAN